MKDNDCTHFSTLQKYTPTSNASYASNCSSFLENFNARFQDIESEQMQLDVFSIPLNVTPASTSPDLQLELVKLMSDDTLKAMCQNKSLLEFYHAYVSKKEFANMKAHALKYSSVFGSTYLCEQLFSKMNIIKSLCRPRLTNENLGMQMRVKIVSLT